MSAVWCVLCRVWPLFIILALRVIRSWTVWAQSSFFWLLDCVLVCDIWDPVREHSSIRFSVNFASTTAILPRTSLSSSRCGSVYRALGICWLMLLPFVDNGILTPSPPSLCRQCCLVPKGRTLPETLRVNLQYILHWADGALRVFLLSVPHSVGHITLSCPKVLRQAHFQQWKVFY